MRQRSGGALGLWLLLAAGVGCAADAPRTGDAGVVEGTRLRFQLGEEATAVAFGDIPFPDDLYLNTNGELALDASPLGDGALLPGLVSGAAALDGFSALSPIYFFVDGSLDPSSLPVDPEASMQPDASLYLLDIDPSSPNAFARVPVEWTWLESAQRLAVRPARGAPLSSQRKYAVVLTTRARDADGAAILPSLTYETVLTASSVPSEPAAARAYRAHINAISAIESAGMDRSAIAGLAVFTVQDVSAGLRGVIELAQTFDVNAPNLGLVTKADALDSLLGIPAPGALGVDGIGGVPHENIGWLIQGTVDAPNCLARLSQEVGRFERDSGAGWMIKRVEGVPFALALPMLDAMNAVAPIPLVVFQHGLGRDHADMLPLTNQLNAAGYAVLAIDAPYHGLRAHGAVDAMHRFSAEPGSDGLADGVGTSAIASFLGAEGAVDAADVMHPAYLRDALRQNVADIVVTLRALLESDGAGLTSIEGLPPISFANDKIGFVGTDIGAQAGLLLASVDDRVDAGVFAVTGGGLAEWILHSPALHAFAGQLLTGLGVDPLSVDYATDEPLFWPGIALWQQIADGGDPLALSPGLRRKSRNLLLVAARNDEVVSNRTTEALAAALQLPIVSMDASRYVTLSRAATPLSANVTISGALATQALFEHAQAGHELFYFQNSARRFVTSDNAPFIELDAPIAIDNPIESALTQTVFFFESWRNGSATVIDPDGQPSVPTD